MLPNVVDSQSKFRVSFLLQTEMREVISARLTVTWLTRARVRQSAPLIVEHTKVIAVSL